MHGGNVENAKASRGAIVVRWLRAGVIDKGRDILWLGLALGGDISRVVGGGLGGGVGIWPELRVVGRSERGGVGMPIVRMIGSVFVVVNLQKVVGVHEGRELKEGRGDETRVGRAGFRPRGTEEGRKWKEGESYYMCYALYVSTTLSFVSSISSHIPLTTLFHFNLGHNPFTGNLPCLTAQTPYQWVDHIDTAA